MIKHRAWALAVVAVAIALAGCGLPGGIEPEPIDVPGLDFSDELTHGLDVDVWRFSLGANVGIACSSDDGLLWSVRSEAGGSALEGVCDGVQVNTSAFGSPYLLRISSPNGIAHGPYTIHIEDDP